MSKVTPNHEIEQLRKQALKAEKAEIKRSGFILNLAKEQHRFDEGTLELDDPTDPTTAISEGEDNGAYVKCWAWVSFYGTKLDKEK